jgi:hypothetical protein
MSVTQTTYTGNGSTTLYSFTFPYIETTDIKVSLDGVVTTEYSLANATTIQFNSAPASGAVIRIFRETGTTAIQSTFFAGSAIRAEDLNDNFNQVLYTTQETVDRRVNKTGDTMTGDLGFSAGKNIVFEGTTDNAFEATLSGGDPTADRTLTLPDVSGTLVSTGDTGTVTSTMLVDGTIVNADINSAAAIDKTKISGTAITTADTGTVTSTIIANGTIVNGDISGSAAIEHSKLANINAGQVLLGNASNVPTSTALSGDVTVTSSGVTAISSGVIVTDDLANSAVTNDKVQDGTLTSAKLSGATVVTNSEQAAATVNDTSFFTTSASDARYFRQDSTETITSGVSWTGSDAFVATTGAIDARIIDLVDDVGGFVPIANETSFPTANPDVNGGAGTLISVQSVGTSRTPSAGTVTIANGSGSNTVTITGCGSTVLAAGYGLIVETTSTLHTYAFHRLVPRATEVTTVAGISADITTAATNVADINNFADVYQINNGDPTQRVDTTALQVGDLVYRSDTNVIRAYNGTNYQDITPNAAVLADISVVADDLATFDDLGSITDALTAAQSGGALETCADNIADIRTLADIEDGTDATDAIQTVAGISTNVTTVAGISADVTAVAGKATEVGRLGTADAVADMAILGTTDVVADMNLLATNDVVADMNTLATTANVANMDTCADDIANINTVAGSISNVNTVATNISDVNSFADLYTISGTAPTSPSAGDLWYDSSAGNNTLKFYDGTTWNTISAGIASLADDTTPELAGALDANNNNLTEVATISGNNLQIDFGTI